MLNNIIYIHICTIENWVEVLSHILNAIITSGLINVTKEIRLGVLGSVNLVNDLINKKYDKIKEKVHIIFHSTNTKLFERPTLEHIRACSEKETFNVLYLHTKGIQRKNIRRRNNIRMWVDMMLHFLVYRFSHCLNLLKTHTSVGCHLCKFTSRKNKTFGIHYSGNFWWATNEHIKYLAKKIGPEYLAPEFWIGSGPKPLFSVHQPKYKNLYDNPYPSSMYCTSSQHVVRRGIRNSVPTRNTAATANATRNTTAIAIIREQLRTQCRLKTKLNHYN